MVRNMEKFYLFGAGKNCYGVIKFVGKQNIKAVVDNNESKQGLEIEGIKIISFQQFLSDYQNEEIIIAAYYFKENIKYQLVSNNITNFIVAPYMQKGYFESFSEMVSDLHIDKLENLYIYGENYFSQKFFDTLLKMKLQYIVKAFIKDESFQASDFCEMPIVLMDEVPLDANVFLASELSDEQRSYFKNKEFSGRIVDMYQGKEKSHPELEKFKNIHRGKRCFIIGNGPSLSVKDLEILHDNNEICFGCNWIIKVFNETKWRPNYFVVLDYNVLRGVEETLQMNEANSFISFFADAYSEDKDRDGKSVYTYQSIKYEKGKEGFSENITEGICSVRTVTYDMLQIAAYMGFNEIYLLGVDCTKNSKHFYDSSTVDNGKLENLFALSSEGWSSQYQGWINGYEKAEEYSRINNFRIYNATRGGELEVFERVDFDALF